MLENPDSKAADISLNGAANLSEEIWNQHKKAICGTASAVMLVGSALLLSKFGGVARGLGGVTRGLETTEARPILDESGYLMSRELQPAAASGRSWLQIFRGDRALHPSDPSLVKPVVGEDLVVPLRNPRKIPTNQLTADDLRVLAADPDPFMRFETASNPRTAPETLRRLVLNERHSSVVTMAAHNGNTPPDALSIVAKSGDFRMQNAVARNPAAPAEALETLAGHDSYIVRANVAKHPNTSEAALNKLAGDSNSLVVSNLVERLYPTPEIIKRAGRSV